MIACSKDGHKQHSDITLENVKVIQVTKIIRYLGSEITKDGKSTRKRDIKFRIAQAQKDFLEKNILHCNYRF